MTKKMLVFLPCIVAAIAIAGCGTGGGGASAKKAPDAFASLDNDPMADALAKGYISTVAADNRVSPSMHLPKAVGGLTPQSRTLFMSTPVQLQPAAGQIGLGTLAPRRQPGMELRHDALTVKAKDAGNGMVEVSSGAQKAMVGSMVRDGKTSSYSIGADGMVIAGNESTFPKLIEASGIGRAVILADGTVTPVEK